MDMFTYGLSGNCIHLHLPTDLHKSIEENGIRRTIDLVNLYLLDAINRIKQMKDIGFYKFQDKDSIYMISPTMIKRELSFLESLDFVTHLYGKKDLNDQNFVLQHPEARLAAHIFGTDKNVGTALIQFDTINSIEWQAKKKDVEEKLKSKGIRIEENKELTEE